MMVRDIKLQFTWWITKEILILWWKFQLGKINHYRNRITSVQLAHLSAIHVVRLFLSESS